MKLKTKKGYQAIHSHYGNGYAWNVNFDIEFGNKKILILLAMSPILVQDPEEGKRSRRRFSAGHLHLN